MNKIIIEEVLKIIKESNGIKAIEIAKKLKTSRNEVNKILYGKLSKLCIRDEQYSWYLLPDFLSGKANSVSCYTNMGIAFPNTDFTVEELEAYISNFEKG